MMGIKKFDYFQVSSTLCLYALSPVDHDFAFLSKPKEPVSKLVSNAQLKNIEVGMFRH